MFKAFVKKKAFKAKFKFNNMVVKTPKDIKKLIACLKYLNMTIDINNSKDRFKLQKVSFLLKSMGIGLNYEFSLNFYGVFSQELYKDSLEFARGFLELKSDYHINEGERAVLERLKEALAENNEALDVAVVIIYKNFVYEDTAKVIAEIKKIKPRVSEKEIFDGINVAKRLLFKPEYFTDEIKQELELWDNVA